MARGQPPRNVPTLTEVVQRPAAAPASGTGGGRADRLVRDVMRRIEPDLESRLREAVAAQVLAQSQSLLPLLRAELEEIVRRAVADALQEHGHRGP